MIRTLSVLLAAVGALAAPPGVPSSSGEVWIQPSIMDSARDAVNVSTIPVAAQNGAWVDANTGGVNNNPPSLPGNTTFLVAKPGQPGSLMPEGGVVAQEQLPLQAVPVSLSNGDLSSNASVNATASNGTVSTDSDVNASHSVLASEVNTSNDTETSTVVSVTSNDTAVFLNAPANATAVNATLQSGDVSANSSDNMHHTEVVDDAVLAHQETVTPSAKIDQSANVSTAVVAAPASAVLIVPGGSVVSTNASDNSNVRVVRQTGDSTALVSSQVGSVESNQTISVPNDQPIVAVLPAGSNMSATWDVTKGSAAPSVMLGSDFAAASANQSAMANASAGSGSLDSSNSIAAGNGSLDSSNSIGVGGLPASNITASLEASGLTPSGMTPVILPPNTSNVTAADVATIPGAIPVQEVSANVTADDSDRLGQNENNTLLSNGELGGNATVAAGNESEQGNHTVVVDDASLVGALQQEQNANASAAANASLSTSPQTDAAVVAMPTAVVVVPSNSVAVVAMSNDSNAHANTRVVRQASDAGNTAMVSTQIGNGPETNQTLSVGDQPVVAVLPPGTNLTATWNVNAGGAGPTVLSNSQTSALALQPAVSSSASVNNSNNVLTASNSSDLAAVDIVPVAAVAGTPLLATNVASNQSVLVTTNGNSANASGAAVSGSDAAANADIAAANAANAGNGGTAVILPVGMSGTGLTAESLANIPGAVPLVVNGARTSNTRVDVPRKAGDTDSLFVIQQNHRFELHIVSYEINQGTDAVKENLAVFVNLTAGALPAAVAEMATNVGHDITPIDANNPKLLAPESTTGYQKIFDGQYPGGQQSIDHTLSLDLCGQIPDKALLQIIAQPSGNQTNGLLSVAKYVCPLNLNFQTATRSTEASWSDTNYCESTSGQFHQKLGYQIRNYNINWDQCQQSRPSQAVS